MSNVYISFLGTNNYVPCHYFVGDFRTGEPVRFVQEATIQYNCADWSTDDRIVIFTTDDALDKNWRDNGHLDKDEKPIPCQGLETRLKNLKLKTPFENKMVTPGYTQQEIWDQFTAVFDTLKPDDSVVFDITHAFRSIPMLAIVVIQYARVFKTINLKGIHYGAFEALGPIHKVQAMPVADRNVLIVDLTPLAQLMDWTVATDRFLKNGDMELMGELARVSVAPILKSSRGQDADAQAIRQLGNALEKMSLALATCRGPEMSQVGVWLKESVNTCSNLNMLPPFKLLFDSLKKRTQPFSGIMLEDGLNAVAWCCKHDLIQQGFTLLEELLFSFLVQKVGGDIKDTRLRRIASQSFSIVSLKKIENPSGWEEPAGKDQQTTRKMIDIILARGELSNKFQKIRDLRNDLNHAGNKANSKTVAKANTFSIELKTLLTDMERILLQEDPVNECAKDSLSMPSLFLLFNHRLTPVQETDAIDTLGVKTFISPPDEISRLWGQIPPELNRLDEYLEPVQSWLESQANPGDFVLIQGDFGACHWIVQAAFAMNLVPIYATTRREAVEDHLPDGTVRLTHQFRHVIFRKYEN